MIITIATTLIALSISQAELSFPGNLQGKSIAAVKKHFPGEWAHDMSLSCNIELYEGMNIKVGSEVAPYIDAMFYKGKLYYLAIDGNHNISAAVAEKYSLHKSKTPYFRQNDKFEIWVSVGEGTSAIFVDRKMEQESRICLMQLLPKKKQDLHDAL